MDLPSLTLLARPLWQEHFLLPRRLLALALLLATLWLSLTDTDGLRQHELMHLLVHLHRLTTLAIDKLVHGTMYFTLCGALWLAVRHRGRRLRPLGVAFLGAFGWGLLMEILQFLSAHLHLGNRSFDLNDLFANGIGALAAVLCCWPIGAAYRAFLRRRLPTR